MNYSSQKKPKSRFTLKTPLKLTLFFFSLLLFSCSDEDQNNDSDFGKYTDYYPLKVGSYFIYEIDSTVHDDFTGQTTTYRYQLKEALTDSFFDEEERINFRMERFYKIKNDLSENFDTINWTFKNVWFITKTASTIERVEENIRYINLTNPIKDDITWDGNVYNTSGSWNYVYKNYGDTALGYSNTVTVEQTDITNLIQRKHYVQQFAKDIGLISYNYIDVESQDISDPNVPVVDRIEKGVELSQHLIDYYIP